MVCVDENIRRCMAILSSWLVDHMVNVNIHCIKVNQCAICVSRRDQLALLPKRLYDKHNHVAYERLLEASQDETQVTYIPRARN